MSNILEQKSEPLDLGSVNAIIREGRLRELLQTLPAAIYTTDTEGRITFFNDAAAELWGLEPEFGTNDWCVSWHLFWPEGRPMRYDQSPMAVALRENRAITGTEAVAERPDGTRIPFLAYPTPLRDESGALTGAINTLVDITENKHAERVSQRLGSIVEFSRDAIVTTNLKGIITSWNHGAERLFGYTAEEAVGNAVTFLYPPDRSDEAAGILGRIGRGERLDLGETVGQRMDGSLVEVSLTMSPLQDARGAIVGAWGIAEDITARRLAEKAGRDIEESFQVLADNIPALCWMAHADGWIHWYNRRWYEYTGTTPESQEGWGWKSVHDPKELPAVLERYNASIASGQPFEMVFPLKGADGAFRPFLTRIVPFRDAEGRIVRWFGTNTDISGEREAATRVRESERKLQELIAALPVAVYTTDAQGRITFYNQAAAELAGREPKIGSDEWCVASTLYWPDGRPMLHEEDPVAAALKHGRPLHGEEGLAERPDGSRIPFLAYPKPLRDESGAITGAIDTLVDITERKHAERVSQRLVSIIECSQDAIVSTDLKGIVTSWNSGAEELFGYMGREVLGKPIAILWPPDRLDEERGITERINRGEYIDPYETIRLRKDGSVIAVSLTVSPVENAEGQIVGASKIYRDITARKRAEEQQNLLLREMNHRVKNLFAVAAGLVSLSARSAGTPADMAAAVRDRLAALARAHELTCQDDPDAEARLDRSPITLDALIQTVFSPYLDPERSEDQGRLVAAGPQVYIGGSAVTSFALILHEFATNAAKYGALTSPTGSIRIHWTTEQDGLQLVWREYGGPSVTGPPGKEGFGSILARRTITGTFAGKVEYDWEPAGVTTRFWIPLDQLGADQIES
jgi:PAS domain S-box-containing protein